MPVEEFIPDKWVFNEIPKKNDQPFTGFKPKAYIVTRHCYPLCMFLLVYSCYIVFARVVLSSIFGLHQLCFGHFFIRINLSKQPLHKNTHWRQHFCMYEIDPQRIRQWFCDMKHWQQVKRFFIVFDPHTDAQHKDDILDHMLKRFGVYICLKGLVSHWHWLISGKQQLLYLSRR